MTPTFFIFKKALFLMTPTLFFYSTLNLKKQLLFYSVKIPSNLHRFKLVSPASHKCLPDIKADIMFVGCAAQSSSY